MPTRPNQGSFPAYLCGCLRSKYLFMLKSREHQQDHPHNASVVNDRMTFISNGRRVSKSKNLQFSPLHRRRPRGWCSQAQHHWLASSAPVARVSNSRENKSENNCAVLWLHFPSQLLLAPPPSRSGNQSRLVPAFRPRCCLHRLSGVQFHTARPRGLSFHHDYGVEFLSP